jgi:hypothetical protein
VARTLRLSPNLRVPLDGITRTYGIFGQRGTGKSTTGAVFVEQAVHAGGRAVVLDPTGVWHGLTREGTGPGLPGVVLGGEHADAPLEATGGDLVAEFVIGTDYPLVVLDMKMLRKGQRQRLAMEFLERLYHDNRDPLMVVIDEAPQFAPAGASMRSAKGEEAIVPRLLGAVEDLVSLGRSRGLGAAMISQRFATVAPNAREQVETLVVHRLMGKLDRTALKGWIEANGDPEREKEVLDTIAKLPTGRALVWSPAFLDFFGVEAIDNATTYDSRATPSVGAPKRKLTARAPIDLEALRERMSETIETHQANDPTKLRQEIRRLERELATRPSEEVVREVKVEVPVLDGELPALEAAIARMEEVAGPLVEVGSHISRASGAVAAAIRDSKGERRAVATAPRTDPAARSPDRPRRAAPPPAPREPSDVGETPKLKRAERAVLNVLAQYNERTVRQVATITGYTSSGGGFRNALSLLRSLGYIEGRDPVSITESGLEAAGEVEVLPTGRALLDHWLIQLKRKAEREVLQVLWDAYPDELDAETIAERTPSRYEPSGGGFRNALGKLRTLELVEGHGMLRASPDLFDA